MRPSAVVQKVQSTILLDASCLLNLYSTGRLRNILDALPQHFAVAAYVRDVEVIYTWRQNPAGKGEIKEAVDLTAVINDGLLVVIDLEGPEVTATFVDLASVMDDGEAISGALAAHHGFALATDDRKARREFGVRLPSTGLVSTLELMKWWSEVASVTKNELRAALEAMISGASYVPGRSDPLYEWWRETLDYGAT